MDRTGNGTVRDQRV